MASCNACLGMQPYGRIKHYKCELNGCTCSCSMNHFAAPLDGDELKIRKKARRLEEKALRPKRRITAKKAPQGITGPSKPKRFYANSKAQTITVDQVPDEVKVRTGRWITDLQKEWILRLREDNWKVEEIADLIGFCHTAVIAQLKKLPALSVAKKV